MNALQWAVLLSVLSTVSYAVAAVVQERLAVRGHRSVPHWVAALGLTGLGALLHVVALGYGSVGIVQALGALTLVLALPIAAVRNPGRVTWRAWRDAGLTTAGLAALTLLAKVPAGTGALTSAHAELLSAVTIMVVAALAVAAWRTPSRVGRSLLLAGAAGTSFAIASVLTKTALVDFSYGGVRNLVLPLLGSIVLLALAGLLLGQFSYRGAGLAAPLAMVSVTNPVVAGIVGILLLGEGFRYGSLGALLALLAALVAARGVIGLAMRTPVVPPLDEILTLPDPGELLGTDTAAVSAAKRMR